MQETESRLEIRWLDPSQVTIERTPESDNIRLTLNEECCYLDVAFARAFPFSDASRYINITTSDGQEVGMFRDLRGMDSASLRILEEQLERRYFIPIITKVHSLKEEFGMLSWDVETDRGKRKFYVRNWRDNVHELGASRYLIIAIDGNRYEIRDYEKLDTDSRLQLERLV
ncbi:MAG: DUF1854 domain-containing protein [Fimbriimonadia bacterium]|nr:DUF1854 domain-containing protein [Fimbriimonadia bacterium]